MKSKQSWDRFYMDFALEVAQLSYAPDRKVGAVAVSKKGVMAFSYNGTVPGSSNATIDSEGITLPCVLHAETSAMAKLNKETSTEGAWLYSTLSPCMDCAKAVYQAGILRVVYLEEYKHGNAALMFLNSNGVECKQLYETKELPHARLFTKEQLKGTVYEYK